MDTHIKKAHNFAKAAHLGQERKFTKVPYLTHLEETAQLLWEVTEGQADQDDYIVAILHDVVEDTDIELIEIGRNFGKIIMDLVGELTNDPVEKGKKGKKSYLLEKMSTMSSRALTIKLCDRLSNVSGLEHDAVTTSFAKWYIKETFYILDNLSRELNEDQEYLIDRIRKMLLYLKISRKL